MAEIIPTLFPINPFDATVGTSVYYSYTGSKQTIENNLVLTDVETKLIVYSFDFASFEKVHHIPPAILTNGKVYSAKIRVKFNDGTYSEYSNELTFMTLARPVLDIDNIDGQGYVYNQDVTFVATYYQENSERVKYYQFSLFDENDDLIMKLPKKTPDNPTTFTQLVTGLEKGKGYFIQCDIETVNGLTYSHKEKFIAIFIVPSINGVISTRNDEEEGFVRVTSNIKQLIGTSVQSDNMSSSANNNTDQVVLDEFEYINNDWIVIPKDNPVIFKGLGMNRASDFVIKIWAKNIPDNTKFMELRPENSNGIPIEFYKEANRIMAYKKLGKKIAVYTSNKIEIPMNKEFMLYVRAIEHRLDLSVTILA